MIDTIVHPYNFRKLDDIYNLLKQMGCIFRWRISLPRMQGSFLDNKESLSVDIEQVLNEYENFIKWYLANEIERNTMDVQVESFFQTEMIRRQEAQIFSSESCCCEYKKDAIAIKPNGDVTPCTSFTDLIFGNLYYHSLQEIWHFSQTQKVKRIKTREVEECNKCEYLYLCGTGCRKVAYDIHGSLYDKDDSMCRVYKFFHERVMPLLSEYDINFTIA
jgi:radical SAM protein with 4Fe4S-binding SPASM domain